MDVILLERIEKLGTIGDEVTVKAGYARNYLIPQGKALRATNENRAFFETQKVELEKKNEERKEEAQKLAKKIEGSNVTIIRQAGDDGRLYGSVTARDISASLGNGTNYSHIRLDKTIKEIGVYPIQVELHAEVKQEILLIVARSESEAQESLKKYLAPEADEAQDEFSTEDTAAESTEGTTTEADAPAEEDGETQAA